MIDIMRPGTFFLRLLVLFIYRLGSNSLHAPFAGFIHTVTDRGPFFHFVCCVLHVTFSTSSQRKDDERLLPKNVYKIFVVTMMWNKKQ
jgi:hypothetical protein